MTRHLPLLAALLVTAAPALAADIVVYHCTDASGAISLRDTPCPASHRQEQRNLPAPASAPARTRSPATTAQPAPIAQAESAPLQTQPQGNPPPMFICQRYDGKQYESTDGVPQHHWVPLWALDADPRAPATALDPATIGRTSPLRRTARDGVPSLAVSGAGLGTWVTDVCMQLTPAQICARRRDTLSGFGRRIFNAGQSDADQLRAEEQQLRSQIHEECGG